MIIDRNITGHLKKMLKKFPVVSITGPRLRTKVELGQKEKVKRTK